MRDYDIVTAERHAARMAGDKPLFGALTAEWRAIALADDSALRSAVPSQWEKAQRQVNTRRMLEVSQAAEAAAVNAERKAEKALAKAEADQAKFERKIEREKTAPINAAAKQAADTLKAERKAAREANKPSPRMLAATALQAMIVTIVDLAEDPRIAGEEINDLGKVALACRELLNQWGL